MSDAEGPQGFPKLTEYEAKIFRAFAARYEPGEMFVHVQLEGDGQIAKVAAALRLEKKGLLCRTRACNWYLTQLGEQLALSTR